MEERKPDRLKSQDVLKLKHAKAAVFLQIEKQKANRKTTKANHTRKRNKQKE